MTNYRDNNSTIKMEEFKTYYVVSFPPYACVYDEYFDSLDEAEKHIKRQSLEEYKLFERKGRLLKEKIKK